MKDLPLDFGLLIAYFIPGLLGVRALAYLAPNEVGPLFVVIEGKEQSVTDFAFLVVVAILVGLIISILRAALIDSTFAINLHRIGIFRSKKHYGTVPRVEPMYDRFRDSGIQSAFHEALAQEKRPYQFYGNALLASLLLVGSWSYAHWGKASAIAPVWVPVLLVAWSALYVGARLSHYRYMRAIESLNSLEPRKDEKLA